MLIHGAQHQARGAWHVARGAWRVARGVRRRRTGNCAKPMFPESVSVGFSFNKLTAGVEMSAALVDGGASTICIFDFSQQNFVLLSTMAHPSGTARSRGIESIF